LWCIGRQRHGISVSNDAKLLRLHNNRILVRQACVKADETVLHIFGGLGQKPQQAIEHERLLLLGPARWGKSWLLENELIPRARTRLPGCIYLDLFALRRVSLEAQDREAARWLFQSDEAAFQEFLQGRTHEGVRSLLHGFLDEHLPRRGLLVVDHLERLPDASDVERWLASLIDYIHDRGLRSIWVERNIDLDSSRLAPWTPGTGLFQMPSLADEELREWLAEDTWTRLRSSGVGVERLKQVTGSRVALARDLAEWLQDRPQSAEQVDKFVEAQAEAYSPGCQWVFDAYCDHPQALGSDPGDLPEALTKRLRLSGIYCEDANGGIVPASPIFEARLASLLATDRLLAAGAEHRGYEPNLSLEVQARRLARHLSVADGFGYALRDLSGFLEAAGFQSVVWLPDPHHRWFGTPRSRERATPAR
jgi:hypothetical protein